jgi:DNA repair exonuclease SbcCD ATPase subunit
MAAPEPKLRGIGEVVSVEDALVKASKAASQKRSAFPGCQGKAFASFVSRQPEAIQSSLLRIGNILAQTQEPVKASDDVFPRMKSDLAPLRPLNEDIKIKRKQTQSLRNRVPKTTKRAEAIQARMEAMRIRNPTSPELPRMQDEYERALGQKKGDVETLEIREAQLTQEEAEYKKHVFLKLLAVLEQFAEARGRLGAAFEQIGRQLDGAAEELPFFADPLGEGLKAELDALQNEPTE